MESPYVVWGLVRRPKPLSYGDLMQLKSYFSSNRSGGGEIADITTDESPNGILLRIEYKDARVVHQVLNRSHNIDVIIGYFPDFTNETVFLSKTKPCLTLNSNQIVESDEENIQSFVFLDSTNPSPRRPKDVNPQTTAAKGDLSCGQAQQQKTVVVEVYKFPEKPLEELIDELIYHFTTWPFNAETFTSPPDAYDNKSKTFKLKFLESDAKEILRSEEQNLLGEETEKIRLRQLLPPKACAVLLTCTARIASDKVIRTEMKKFGDVKDVRKVEDINSKFLVIFQHHEDAVKAAKAGAVTITGKHMTITLWDEPLENSEPSAASPNLPSPKVSKFINNKVLVSCGEYTSSKVVERAMNAFGKITECTGHDEPNTFVVEFAESSDAYKAANKQRILSGQKSFNIELYKESFSNTDSYVTVQKTVDIDRKKCVDNIAHESGSSKTYHLENQKDRFSKVPAEGSAESENSIVLVSNLSDVDNQLLAHWIGTVTGLWPLSCLFNDTKDKAIVQIPSSIDTSLFLKASEEDYFLHGSHISTSILQPTTKMLAEFNNYVQHNHQDAVRLYFSSNQCGLKTGQMVSLAAYGDDQKAFIITYSEHRAIQEIIQKANHSFMGNKIEVGEFYQAVGYCRPRNRYVFPARKSEGIPDKAAATLIIKNVTNSEILHLELLMKNSKKSGGDKSAEISFRENLAYVSYSDINVTNAVFDKSQRDGIHLNEKRLEIDLDTTELTSRHDHKAARLSGLPENVDPDRLKFYLSYLSGNLVTSMSFQENGDRAVAHFKDNIDMLLLYSNYQTTKLEGYEKLRIQPELKSTSVLVSALSEGINANFLELMIDDILPSSHFEVKPLEAVKSSWIVQVPYEDVDQLAAGLSNKKDVRVSHFSEFLGPKVNTGIHRKAILLSNLVMDPSLLLFILDNKLSGYKELIKLVQKYDCKLSDDGAITMDFDSQNYVAAIKKWEDLKGLVIREVKNSWCVDKSIIVPKEVTNELSDILSFSKTKVKISCQEECLVIAGEKKDVKETVSVISQAIRGIEEKKREERETTKEILKLKDFEIAYLGLIKILNELKDRFPVKELSLDVTRSCVIIHANNKHIDGIKKAIKDITSSLCESTVSKSDLFVKKCESEFATRRILEELTAKNLLAVCVPDKKKLTAYAKTKEIAQMALKTIDEVVWEIKYPVGRAFDEEEKKFLQKNKHLWEKAKLEISAKESTVDIVETLDDTCFVIIGCGKGKQNTILKDISEFFNSFLPKSTIFAGNPYHIKYISRFKNADLSMIEQKTNATINCTKDEVCISGSNDQTSRAEQQLRELHDKIINDRHKITVDYLIQFLLSEPEIFEDLGKACQTLIILENADKLRIRIPEPIKAQSSLILHINITPRTALQIKKAEIHEIHDCDGLAIPTSRNLKLSELNSTFAEYVKEKGGSQISNECFNSPEAVKSGRKLLPGSILTTSAGEFRELRRIIHMVLVDWSRPDTAISVLEKCLKSTFLSASEHGITALLIPMTSFPDDSDYAMVIKSLIKTIKLMKDDLPPRIVLLETQTIKMNDLKSSFNVEFQSVRDDPEPVPIMKSPASRLNAGLATSTDASTPTIGSQPSRKEIQKLSGTQLLIGGCKFTVVQGLLQQSQQKAIVNSTGQSISLQENPLAKALSDAAGPELQVECTSLAPLREGEVKASKAYKLNCKNILHCRINGHYKDDQSEKDLMGLIVECLRKVDQDLQLTSVAFPALGTGVLRYPGHVVAKCMINGLMEYTSKNTLKHLSEVVVVIFPSDTNTYKAFEDTIEKSDRPDGLPITLTPKNESKTKKLKSGKEFRENFTREALITLNNTVIAVQQGDIIQYSGKAIVCPSNRNLHVAGHIASQLMKDSHIQKEMLKANLKEMASNGVCLIRTCPDEVKIPKYQAEYIIFADSYSPLDAVVNKCLEKCLKNQVESVAFPFIGTGLADGRESAEKKVKILLTAAIQFVNSCGKSNLKNIDFVIFGSEPCKIFVKELHDLREQPSLYGRFTGALKSISGWLGSSNEKESEEANSSMSPNEDSKALHMTIYGMEHAQIQATKEKLNNRLEKETVVIQWDKTDTYEDDKPLIASLSLEQANYLNDAAERMGVDFMLDQELRNIQITGSKAIIYDYRDLVKKELQEVERNNFTRKHQEYQTSNFNWAFREEKEEKWSDFHWEDSHYLESNYKQNPAAQLTFTSKAFKASLKVDLQKNSFKLHGLRYLIKRIDRTACFPDGWDESAGEQAEVVLNKASKEYQAVEANFRKTMTNSNPVILEIKRVQHLTAYRQYMEQRRLVAYKLKRPEDQVEKTPVWHGSTEDTVRKIAKSFFNRSYSGANATYFGKGSYFARDAIYSANDTYSRPNDAGEKYMFQARVIVGDYTKGSPDMIDCPLKPDGTSYDSVVENVQNPGMYVVFHDTAAYPEYIIKFRM